jgi:hypothetical protein
MAHGPTGPAGHTHAVTDPSIGIDLVGSTVSGVHASCSRALTHVFVRPARHAIRRFKRASYSKLADTIRL